MPLPCNVSLERVELVESLLLLVFAGRLVARIILGRRGLLLGFAVGRGSAGIGAGLHLRSCLHIVGLRRSLRRLFDRRQRLIVGRADRRQSARILCARNSGCCRCRRCALAFRWSRRSPEAEPKWAAPDRRCAAPVASPGTDDAGSDRGSAASRCATIRFGHILQLKRRAAIRRGRSSSAGNRGGRLGQGQGPPGAACW